VPQKNIQRLAGPIFCLWAVSAFAAADRIEPFQPTDHLVATYYFNWYIDGVTYKYRNWNARPDPRTDAAVWTWKPYYPKGEEAGAAIFGLNDTTAWPRNRLPDTTKWPDSDDMLYHVAELRAMKWAGVDIVFLDLWWPNDFITRESLQATAEASKTKGKETGKTKSQAVVAGKSRGKIGNPCREMSAFFQAWQYLDRRGERPVKISFILETPSFQKADLRGAGGEPSKLFDAVWSFYRLFFGENQFNAVMPCRSLAAMKDPRGRTKLLFNLFLPRMPGESNGEWVSRWDAGTFENLRAQFDGMTGLALYICANQHLHGTKYGGWDGVQVDGSVVDITRRRGLIDQEITWHASLAGPQIREDSISIGAGYCNRSRDSLPGGAKKEDGSPAYPRAFRYLRESDTVSTYEQQWRDVLASPENFKKHLVVIECWNELIEGSQVSPAEPATMRDAQGRYVDRWGDSPTQYLEATRKYVAVWKGMSEEDIEKAAKPLPPETQPAKKSVKKRSSVKRK